MDGTFLLAAAATGLFLLGQLAHSVHHPLPFAFVLLLSLAAVRVIVLTPQGARSLGWIGGRSKMATSLRLAPQRVRV